MSPSETEWLNMLYIKIKCTWRLNMCYNVHTCIKCSWTTTNVLWLMDSLWKKCQHNLHQLWFYIWSGTHFPIAYNNLTTYIDIHVYMYTNVTVYWSFCNWKATIHICTFWWYFANWEYLQSFWYNKTL